jgi:hypothetical protein
MESILWSSRFSHCNDLKNYKKLSNFINKKASSKTHKMGKSLDDTQLIIFHQNVQGLRKKTNDLLYHLSQQLPHILCFTKHHLTLHKSSRFVFINLRVVLVIVESNYKKELCVYM